MSWAEGHGTSQKDNLWFVKATTLMQSGGTVDVEIEANLWALFGAHMNMKVYGQMWLEQRAISTPRSKKKLPRTIKLEPAFFHPIMLMKINSKPRSSIFKNPSIWPGKCESTKPWAQYSSRIVFLCRKCVPTWICRRLRI